MGLASALSTALTGLNAAETSINVIGNNLANSSTIGYKASSPVFATQFAQTTSLGSAPSGDSGGTNPSQIGLGVQVAEISPNFTQGTLQVSSSPSDLAIQGNGFFMVRGEHGPDAVHPRRRVSNQFRKRIGHFDGRFAVGIRRRQGFQSQHDATPAADHPAGNFIGRPSDAKRHLPRRSSADRRRRQPGSDHPECRAGRLELRRPAGRHGGNHRRRTANRADRNGGYDNSWWAECRHL